MNDPQLTTLALMALAGFVAGWIDAVVGGGGLIQIPALLLGFPGATPAQVLATNKLGSIAGTVASATTVARTAKRPSSVSGTPPSTNQCVRRASPTSASNSALPRGGAGVNLGNRWRSIGSAIGLA